jgi:hypothetical protein
MANKYSARLATQPKCGHWPDQIVLDGPALREMVRDQMADLAYSILDGDGRAKRWGEYLVAVGDLLAAERFGAEEAALEWLANAVSMAWNALEADLSTSLYLRMPDAQAVAHLLHETTSKSGVKK